jgi:hypothetical protein
VESYTVEYPNSSTFLWSVVGALAAWMIAGAAKLLFVVEACVMKGFAVSASARLFRGSSGHRRILSRSDNRAGGVDSGGADKK